MVAMFFYTCSHLKSREVSLGLKLEPQFDSHVFLQICVEKINKRYSATTTGMETLTPSCAFSWWQTVEDWAASVCECDSVNAKQRVAEKTA